MFGRGKKEAAAAPGKGKLAAGPPKDDMLSFSVMPAPEELTDADLNDQSLLVRLPLFASRSNPFLLRMSLPSLRASPGPLLSRRRRCPRRNRRNPRLHPLLRLPGRHPLRRPLRHP